MTVTTPISTTLRPARATSVAPSVRADAVTRWLLGGVAFAAGIVGVAMLAAPGSTGTYFSWAIDPPAMAAVIGACYIASTLVFGWAAWRGDWTRQRGLCVAVLGLAGPTLPITFRHRAVFDFDRWQAVAWVALFAASVISFGCLAITRRRSAPLAVEAGTGARLGRGARATLAVIGVAYAAIAVLLWSSPIAVSTDGPLTTGPMAIRFLGSWAAFLALVAWYAATHPERSEAGTLLAALVIFPIAVFVAVLLHLGAYRSGNSMVASLTVLAALTTAAVAVAAAGWESDPVRGSGSR